MMTKSELETAVEWKERGNLQFKSGNFGEALSCYTQALDLSTAKDEKLIYYKNRAACNLKLVRYLFECNQHLLLLITLIYVNACFTSFAGTNCIYRTSCIYFASNKLDLANLQLKIFSNFFFLKCIF